MQENQTWDSALGTRIPRSAVSCTWQKESTSLPAQSPGLGAGGAAIWGREDRMSLGITDLRRGVPNALAAGIVGNAQLRPPAPTDSCGSKKWNSRASEDRLL